VLDDLPILEISKVTLGRKFKNLVDIGVLKQHINKTGGTYVMFAIGDEYSRLIQSDTYVQKSTPPIDEKVHPYVQKSTPPIDEKVQTKIHLLEYPSTNTREIPALKEIDSIVLLWGELFKTEVKRDSALDRRVSKAISEYGTNEVMNTIKKYHWALTSNESWIETPLTMFSFFNGDNSKLSFSRFYHETKETLRKSKYSSAENTQPKATVTKTGTGAFAIC
jgi:hypothetical protein